MKSKPPIRESLKNADHRGELISCLLSFERNIRLEECGPVLRELHNSGEISLVSDNNLAAIEAISHNDFWSVIHLLNEVIPELDCSYQEILRLVDALTLKAGPDLASGLPKMSLVKWCNANPEKAKMIVEGAKCLEKLCLSHCVFAIQGLESVELAFELLGHSNNVVVTAGLSSLGRLKIESETIVKQIIDECCKAVKNENDKNLRSAAIETAFTIWEKHSLSEPYRQQEFLDNVINAKEGDDLVLLSAALFYYSKGLMTRSIDKILTALTGETSNPQVILRWLDDALMARNRHWNFSLVMEVFAAQLPKLGNSIKSSNYHNFWEWIWTEPDYTGQIFSNWLISGQFWLCEFLADMLVKVGKSRKIVEISKVNLPKESDDQIFLAQKCIGFLWFHEVTAASILLSIVKNGKKAAGVEAEKLLYDPLLLCYSGELRKFLEEQCNNSSKKICDCAQRLIESHDTYLKGLKKVDDLVELYPTIEQRRAALLKERDRNRMISKSAHKKSIFSQVFPQQTLLYGKKCFYLIHGENGKKIPSVTSLSELSYSAELPSLSVIDPVGFNEMLLRFRVARKV